MFRPFHYPEVLGVTASSHVAHMVHIVAFRNVAVEHLEYCAVEHLDIVLVLTRRSKTLPEVTISIQAVADRHEASRFEFYEAESPVAWISESLPTCLQPGTLL